MELSAELIAVIQLAVVGGVTWIVVEGVKGVVEAFGGNMNTKIGKFANALAAVIAASAVATIIGVINLALAQIPPEFIPVVREVLALLTGALTAMGFARRVREARANPE